MSAALPAAPAPRLRAAPAGAPSAYVLVPTRLIADLRATPQAIGVYALVGRLFFIERAPVPLSASDLRRYDPALSDGQAVRALAKLVRGGWLIAQPDARKHAYTPAWGWVAGAPRPWDVGAPMLARPRHVAALRLDRRLLDLLMGQLRPHPHQPASVRRYLTAPALTLADVGRYALGLDGVSIDAPALARLGLIRDRRPAPLPTEDGAILARASQLALATADGVALSERGLARLGIAPVEPAERGRPLVFVPEGMLAQGIAGPIARPITRPAAGGAPDAAAGSATAGPAPVAPASAGTPCTGWDQSDPPQPPRADPRRERPGGGRRTRVLREPTGGSGPAEVVERDPPSPAVRLLRELGVRASVAADLAGTPESVVQATIADARTRPGVRDPAAWVVARLRDARERSWQAAPAGIPAQALAAPQAALPAALAALDVGSAITEALTDLTDPPVPPAKGAAAAACCCDGSGVFVYSVPPDHPLFGKVQLCPCRRRETAERALTRDAGAALAASDLAAVQVDDRPYRDLTWAGRAFTPAEQAATLRRAVAACERAARAPERGVTLLGPPGSGKTTLAAAAAKALAIQHGLTLRYASLPQLLAAIRQEAAEHGAPAALERALAAPVLVLDDLGRERLTAWAREQLYRLLDERMRGHAPGNPRITLITSNLTFAELYALDAALASRVAAHTEVRYCVASDYRLHAAEGEDR